jgi:hypothetical protein
MCLWQKTFIFVSLYRLSRGIFVTTSFLSCPSLWLFPPQRARTKTLQELFQSAINLGRETLSLCLSHYLFLDFFLFPLFRMQHLITFAPPLLSPQGLSAQANFVLSRIPKRPARASPRTPNLDPRQDQHLLRRLQGGLSTRGVEIPHRALNQQC